MAGHMHWGHTLGTGHPHWAQAQGTGHPYQGHAPGVGHLHWGHTGDWPHAPGTCTRTGHPHWGQASTRGTRTRDLASSPETCTGDWAHTLGTHRGLGICSGDIGTRYLHQRPVLGLGTHSRAKHPHQGHTLGTQMSALHWGPALDTGIHTGEPHLPWASIPGTRCPSHTCIHTGHEARTHADIWDPYWGPPPMPGTHTRSLQTVQDQAVAPTGVPVGGCPPN